MSDFKESAYWDDRFKLLEESSHKTAEETYRDIEKALNKTQSRINAELEKWYARFAENNQLDITDAKKLLNARELKEFKWDIDDYIKAGKENAVDQRWMKELENASAKFHISRLEALKIQTQNHLEVAYGNQLDELDHMMKDIYTDHYYKSVFEMQKGLHIGFPVGEIDENRLKKVLNKPWSTDGLTFSDRIWNHKTNMINTLHQEVTSQLIRGDAPDKVIKELTQFVDKKFKNARYYASRLVMTEEAFIASASQKDAFNELDVEQYQIVATLDTHTSDICQGFDGKVVDMKDYVVGVSAPPFHVNCRTVTVPYFDDEDGERIYRDKEGNVDYVPSNMVYPDWYKIYVEKSETMEDWMKEHRKPETESENKKPFEFTPAKTITEAEEYANKFVDDSKFGALGVSYKGVHIDIANEINMTVGKFYDTFDVEKLGGISAPAKNTKLGKMINAHMGYSPIRNSIVLNRDNTKTLSGFLGNLLEDKNVVSNYLNDPNRYDLNKCSERVRNVFLNSKTSGRGLVAESIEDAVNHELGHYMERYLKDYRDVIEKNMVEYSSKISGYATDSYSEYIAESFASYMKGEDLIDPELKNILDGMKK